LIFARRIGNFANALVDHAVNALRFVRLAIDGVLDLFGCIAAAVMRLAEHWSNACHLEHQPLEHLVAAARVCGYQPPGLLGKIDQNSARLEN
jgi:hypothetical protein